MNIVYAMTRNVYEWSVPGIRSLAEHNPKAKVYILCEDDTFPIDLPIRPVTINVSGQEWFTEKNCVNYRNQFGNYINLLKVVLPEILPKLKKVIWLDIDTIICEPLDAFWNTDVTGKWIAAAQERHGSYRPFGPLYWNAGVMLINLDQMRKDGIVPTMVDYLRQVRQPYADQDAWMKYGIERDKIVTLDGRWNENEICGKSDRPAIVHYCGITGWWNNHQMDRHEYLERYT